MYSTRIMDADADLFADWTPTGLSAPSMTEARGLLLGLDVGKWKWAKPSGNGIRTAYFKCNAHKDCERLVSILKNGDMFYINIKGKHATESSRGKRKNSALNWEEEKKLVEHVDNGGRPGSLHANLTKHEAARLKTAGDDPLTHKLPSGGLPGELHPACVLHVSCRTCTTHTNTMYPHVSACISMYLTRICVYRVCIDHQYVLAPYWHRIGDVLATY